MSSASVKCSLCEKRIDLRLLKCQHTFCASCIEVYAKMCDNYLICTTCGSTQNCSDIGKLPRPRTLKPDTALSEERTTQVEQECSVPNKTCFHCMKGIVATKTCVSCRTWFCDKCSPLLHTDKALEHHTITRLHPKQFCYKHTDIFISNVCASCNLALCSSCSRRHRDHNIERIETLAEETRKWIDVGESPETRLWKTKAASDLRRQKWQLQEEWKILKQQPVWDKIQFKFTAIRQKADRKLDEEIKHLEEVKVITKPDTVIEWLKEASDAEQYFVYKHFLTDYTEESLKDSYRSYHVYGIDSKSLNGEGIAGIHLKYKKKSLRDLKEQHNGELSLQRTDDSKIDPVVSSDKCSAKQQQFRVHPWSMEEF